MKWVRHRFEEAPGRVAATPSRRPGWAPDVTSSTPDRPRATRSRRKAVHPAPSSVVTRSRPRISFRPSRFTAVAITQATFTTLPPSRTRRSRRRCRGRRPGAGRGAPGRKPPPPPGEGPAPSGGAGRGARRGSSSPAGAWGSGGRSCPPGCPSGAPGSRCGGSPAPPSAPRRPPRRPRPPPPTPAAWTKPRTISRSRSASASSTCSRSHSRGSIVVATTVPPFEPSYRSPKGWSGGLSVSERMERWSPTSKDPRSLPRTPRPWTLRAGLDVATGKPAEDPEGSGSHRCLYVHRSRLIHRMSEWTMLSEAFAERFAAAMRPTARPSCENAKTPGRTA